MNEMTARVLSPLIGRGTIEDPFRPSGTDALSHWWMSASNAKGGGRYLGDWQPDTLYKVDDTVSEPSTNHLHRCHTEHRSASTFSLDASNWELKEALVSAPESPQVLRTLGPAELVPDWQAVAQELTGKDHVKLDSTGPHKSGTFTDDFNRPDEWLDASPNWTLLSGTNNGALQVISNELDFAVTNSQALYVCPDQGNADQFTQAVWKGSVGQHTGNAPWCILTRVTDVNNWYGPKFDSSMTRLYKRVGGGYGVLGTLSGLRSNNDVIRVESIGDEHELFINSVSQIGPVTDISHLTATRQGFIGRTLQSDGFDDFAAGSLAELTATIVPRMSQINLGEGFRHAS